MKPLKLWIVTMLISSNIYAQLPIPPQTKVSETALFQREYPRVDAKNQAYFRLYAPQASKVQVVCGKSQDMEKLTRVGGTLPPLLFPTDFTSIISH